MNDRIQQLAEQAGLDYMPDPDLLRFANLIVKECADVIDEVQTEGGDFIRRHFGVDE